MESNYGTPVNVTATGLLATGSGRVVGFYVNSTSSGVIAFRDGGSSGTVLSGSITPAIGFHWFPAAYATNLHVTLVSGSINLTAFIN